MMNILGIIGICLGVTVPRHWIEGQETTRHGQRYRASAAIQGAIIVLG